VRSWDISQTLIDQGRTILARRGDLKILAWHLGIDPVNLVIQAYVCRRFPPSRRRPALSLSHHRAVASLAPAAAKFRRSEAQND